MVARVLFPWSQCQYWLASLIHEGLDGRPCPVPLAHLLGKHDPSHPRATIKTLPAPLHHPRPYGILGLRLSLMRITAD